MARRWRARPSGASPVRMGTAGADRSFAILVRDGSKRERVRGQGKRSTLTRNVQELLLVVVHGVS